MPQLDGLNILICQPFFSRYSGSELVTLELAESMSAAGAEVRVATWFAGDRMRSELESIPGACIDHIDSDALAEELRRNHPDIIWSNQGLIPSQVPIDGSRYVFAHLSSFHSFEFSFNPRIERALAQRVYFVSQETMDHQIESGAFSGFDKSLFRIFGNPAPPAFHDAEIDVQTPVRTDLSSLLVVSNHVPPEIVEIVRELRQDGVDVNVVGLERPDLSATPRRVTAELVARHDAVLTIGKTVQYGLCMGRPVFCYDHFGGPGWINADNVGRARYHNFSGRGFTRRPRARLSRELREGYQEARAFAVSLVDHHRGEFNYDGVMKDLAAMVEGPCVRGGTVSAEETEGYLRAHMTVGDFGRAFFASEEQIAQRSADLDLREQANVERQQEFRELQDTSARLRSETEAARHEVESLRTELDAMRKTLSWRVTRPLRAVRGVLPDRE